MTAAIIDGKAVAAALRERVAGAVQRLQSASGVTPGLAVVLVGDDPASHVYVRNKGIATKKAGMASFEHRLPATAREEDVVALVRRLNADDAVDGILVQMPLPAQIDAHKVINEIDPAKDVDGLTQANAGRLLLGATGLVPCTPHGSVLLIKTVEQKLSGLHAVVVGRSILVGKPLSLLLLAENCTVTMAHSRTKDLAAVCRSADILCAAVGKAELVQGDWVKEGAIVIDVGINRVGDRLIGDVDYAAAATRARAITPVPGGVGPMTIACLLKNTVLAAARRRGLADPEI
ncbi:MAG: bifunctional methylenetetrahydrofolate dehydrogenase/methenyltetrahydrofolate cyclohydrolase [Alphaproteobacteria bacterium RIFCSPHIGHO2_12_FULL_63_12]|nr:MAG: bifunctional methylenetetrahydrofolate dehydrogenase/methenyltetrahydrofolate cyclohydrolase [Alphaproteobacteria bacterium RIFCSPHIGHO2_12_FULL_63_12]